eukprot:NODE_2218_length_2265_cov_6.149205.p1 GENE.NODE_2218_length_2265_cov_6.149205~~NODE_2218_length_2265_cov_6.149205.p1  ORF type:complete len:490 (-),score=135.52 NODE_2218_length_2265_cov_6.149205:795-2189(-)
MPPRVDVAGGAALSGAEPMSPGADDAGGGAAALATAREWITAPGAEDGIRMMPPATDVAGSEPLPSACVWSGVRFGADGAPVPPVCSMAAPGVLATGGAVAAPLRTAAAPLPTLMTVAPEEEPITPPIHPHMVVLEGVWGCGGSAAVAGIGDVRGRAPVEMLEHAVLAAFEQAVKPGTGVPEQALQPGGSLVEHAPQPGSAPSHGLQPPRTPRRLQAGPSPPYGQPQPHQPPPQSRRRSPSPRGGSAGGGKGSGAGGASGGCGATLAVSARSPSPRGGGRGSGGGGGAFVRKPSSGNAKQQSQSARQQDLRRPHATGSSSARPSASGGGAARSAGAAATSPPRPAASGAARPAAGIRAGGRHTAVPGRTEAPPPPPPPPAAGATNSSVGAMSVSSAVRQPPAQAPAPVAPPPGSGGGDGGSGGDIVMQATPQQPLVSPQLQQGGRARLPQRPSLCLALPLVATA